MSIRGQLVGGLLGAIGLIGSFLVIGLGHDPAGVVIATTSVISLAGIFVLGRESQKQERNEKAKIREQMKAGKPVETIEGSS